MARRGSDGGARLDAARSFLAERGASWWATASLANLAYFAGYRGEGTLLVGAERTVLVTYPLYEEEAERVREGVEVVVARRGLAKAMRDALGGARGGSCLVAESEGIWLLRALRKAGLRPRVEAMPPFRTRKEPRELEAIARAYEVVESALEAVFGELREGMTEREVAGLVVRELTRFGGEGAAFEPIVAFGANTSLPHARPGDAVLERGGLALFDVGARVDGYCSDITRCVLFGRGSDGRTLKRQYAALRAAQDAALERLAAGERSARKVDEAARRELARRRLASRFIHGLGHGIGLEVHEAPTLSRHSSDELADGMAFTIEPGVYFTGRYGLRLEDAVYLRDGNPVLLTSLPRDLITI